MLRIRLIRDPNPQYHPEEVREAHVGLVLDAFAHHTTSSGVYPNGFYLVTAEEYLRAMREYDQEAFLWLDERMGDAVEKSPIYSAIILVPAEFCEPFKGAVN